MFGIHKINNTGVRLRSRPRDGSRRERGEERGGGGNGGESGEKERGKRGGEVETPRSKIAEFPVRFCGQRSLTSDHLEITYTEFSDLCRERRRGKISRWFTAGGVFAEYEGSFAVTGEAVLARRKSEFSGGTCVIIFRASLDATIPFRLFRI